MGLYSITTNWYACSFPWECTVCRGSTLSGGTLAIKVAGYFTCTTGKPDRLRCGGIHDSSCIQPHSAQKGKNKTSINRAVWGDDSWLMHTIITRAIVERGGWASSAEPIDRRVTDFKLNLLIIFGFFFFSLIRSYDNVGGGELSRARLK